MNRWICVALCIGLLGGCKKDDEGDPPDLAPRGSLALDIAALSGAPPDAKNGANATLGDAGVYSNFGNAWLRVRIIHAVAVLVVAVPAAAMGVALSKEPIREGDQWIWTVTALNYTVELNVAVALEDGWQAELYVSNPDRLLSRFLWVEGDANLDLTDGSWTLHDPDREMGDTAALTIDWDYASDTDRSLTYTVVASTSPDVGDSFDFTVDGANATILYTDADDAQNVATISWDTGTIAGSIMVPLYLEGALACWDENWANTDCP